MTSKRVQYITDLAGADEVALCIGLLLEDASMTAGFSGDKRIPAPIHMRTAIKLKQTPELRKSLINLLQRWDNEGDQLNENGIAILKVIAGISNSMAMSLNDYSDAFERLLNEEFIYVDPENPPNYFSLTSKAKRALGVE